MLHPEAQLLNHLGFEGTIGLCSLWKQDSDFSKWKLELSGNHEAEN